jgi:hypothetical protein
MNRKIRLSLLAAIAVCAFAATPAFASRGIDATPSGSYTATGRVSFSSSGVSGSCDVTYTASIGLVAKSVGAISGRMTAITFANCLPAGMVVVAQNVNQWAWLYNSFTGTLPNITSVLYNVVNVQILVTTLLWRCLFIGTQGLRFTPPNLHTWLAATFNLLAQPLNSLLCPSSFNVVASNTVDPVARRLVLLN